MFHIRKKYDLKMILLILLFFCAPLIFSPGFSVFASGYERYKVYYIILLVGIIGSLSIFQERKNLCAYFQKNIFILGVIAIYGLVWVFLQHQTFSDIIMGSLEKTHGFLFFGALFGLFALLDGQYPQESRNYLAKYSLYAGIFLCIYALMQYAGVDPVMGRYYHDGWDVHRVFASLGNPNYLAGYLLLLLPLLGVFKRWQIVLVWGLFSLFIVLTGSIVGIALLIIYTIWKVLTWYEVSHRLWIAGFLLFIIAIGGYFLLPHEKLLSIAARFSLWSEAFNIFMHHPLILLLGNGPDTIVQYVSSHAIILNSDYFSTSSIIDSFHNIVLDSVFFFGLPLVFLFCIWIIKRWQYLSPESREGFLLFLLFFSMNIAISVHFLLLVFYITREKGKK